MTRWNRKSSKYLYQSQWYNVRQDEVALSQSQDITYTLIEHPGYSMVVPLLPDGRVILEKIYRYTIGKTLLECPSGSQEESDTPEACARRELLEETGYEADTMTLVGSFYGSTGISDELFHLFVATGLTDIGKITRELTEDIVLVEMPLSDAADMALSGQIVDAASALALILAERHVREGQIHY